MNHRHPITTRGSKTTQFGIAATLPPSAVTDAHREKALRPMAGLVRGSPAAPYLPLGSRPGRTELIEAERPRVAAAAAEEASRTLVALVRQPRLSSEFPSPPRLACDCLSCDRNRPSLVDLLLIFFSFFLYLFVYLELTKIVAALGALNQCSSVLCFTHILLLNKSVNKITQGHSNAVLSLTD